MGIGRLKVAAAAAFGMTTDWDLPLYDFPRRLHDSARLLRAVYYQPLHCRRFQPSFAWSCRAVLRVACTVRRSFFMQTLRWLHHRRFQHDDML